MPIAERVARLRESFAAADPATRQQLLSSLHDRHRLIEYRAGDSTISDRDAHLLIANQDGYACWSKYESFLNLDPAVRAAINAVRSGDLDQLRQLLRDDPRAANPHWVAGVEPPREIPNDSIPLHCVSEGVFNGTNTLGNDYELTRALIDSGADVDLGRGIPLESAASFNSIGAVRALVDGGAKPDGPRGDGSPISFALIFGFTAIAEILAEAGAKLDLRFAAGVGKLDVVKSFFNADGSLTPNAGELTDPYHNRFRCERTRDNILSQALFFACLHERYEVADYLLAQGAGINTCIPGFDTSAPILHLISSIPFGSTADVEELERARLPLAQFLLDRGASLTVKDAQFGSTALGWAEHFERKHLAAFFQTAQK